MTYKPSDIFSEKRISKKIRVADELLHAYYGMLPEFGEVPWGDDLILKRLSDKYGHERVQDFLDVTEEHEESASPASPEDDDMDLERDLAEWERPQLDPAMLKKDEEFRGVCNSMCSLSASLAICTCNLYGSLIGNRVRFKALRLVNTSAVAYMLLSRGMQEILPPVFNFAGGAAFANHARRYLQQAVELIDSICKDNEAFRPQLDPMQEIGRKALGFIDKYVENCRSADNDCPF